MFWFSVILDICKENLSLRSDHTTLPWGPQDYDCCFHWLWWLLIIIFILLDLQNTLWRRVLELKQTLQCHPLTTNPVSISVFSLWKPGWPNEVNTMYYLMPCFYIFSNYKLWWTEFTSKTIYLTLESLSHTHTHKRFFCLKKVGFVSVEVLFLQKGGDSPLTQSTE